MIVAQLQVLWKSSHHWVIFPVPDSISLTVTIICKSNSNSSTDFRVLILCPVYLLLAMTLEWRFPAIITPEWLTSSFVLWSSSFSCLIALDNSSPVSRSGKSKASHLVPDHRDKAFKFSLLSKCCLWCVMMYCSVPNLVRGFYQESVLNFLQLFFSMQQSNNVFIPHFVTVVCDSDWCLWWFITVVYDSDWPVVNYSCIQRTHPNWTWCMILYMWHWI